MCVNIAGPCDGHPACGGGGCKTRDHHALGCCTCCIPKSFTKPWQYSILLKQADAVAHQAWRVPNADLAKKTYSRIVTFSMSLFTMPHHRHRHRWQVVLAVVPYDLQCLQRVATATRRRSCCSSRTLQTQSWPRSTKACTACLRTRRGSVAAPPPPAAPGRCSAPCCLAAGRAGVQGPAVHQTLSSPPAGPPAAAAARAAGRRAPASMAAVAVPGTQGLTAAWAHRGRPCGCPSSCPARRQSARRRPSARWNRPVYLGESDCLANRIQLSYFVLCMNAT